MSKYYYHAVDSFRIFMKILSDGEIKSPRLLGKTLEKDYLILGLNGLDYICLCNKLDKNVSGYSSFETFIFDTYCFIISDDIDVIKPSVFKCNNDMDYLEAKSRALSEGIQLSTFADEYRTKYRITMDKIIGIGIPFNNKYLDFKEEVKQILDIADVLGLDIVDSSDEYFIEKYESRKYNKEEVVQKIKGLGL